MPPQPTIEVINNSLSKHDVAVFRACAKCMGSKYIHVWGLQRFGYSGARLFEVRLDKSGTGAPYVVKIDTAADIFDEYTALQRATAYFHDAVSQRATTNSQGADAAIIYRLFADSPNAATVTELNDLYAAADNKKNDALVCSTLRRLYEEHCRSAHTPQRTKRILLSSEYRRYLRGSRPDRIPEVFGTSAASVEVFGSNYPHPSHVLKEVLKLRINARTGFVHGDLHPNNVVLDQARHPHPH